MSTDQQEARATGSVPHAFRMAVAWRWAKEMPRPLRGGFLTLLYALAALADTAGRVRFARDGKPIRISDIAEASGCDQKDCRRYLMAAEVAGVVVVEGERKRGKTTLYIILVTPIPDWEAAAASLSSTRRKSRTAPPWLDESAEKNGGVSPELFEPENGGHTPELSSPAAEKDRGTHPRTSQEVPKYFPTRRLRLLLNLRWLSRPLSTRSIPPGWTTPQPRRTAHRAAPHATARSCRAEAAPRPAAAAPPKPKPPEDRHDLPAPARARRHTHPAEVP